MKRDSERARSTLSPDRILNLAVSIADTEGLSAVSMRRLARELSVTPMALYWHFADKDRLIEAMAEQVVADGEFANTPSDHWDEQLRSALNALIDLLHQHPWMGRAVIERLVPLPNYLGAFEVMLDSTRQAGLGPRDGAVLAQQAVQAVVILTEYEPSTTPPTTATAAACDAERERLDALPADQFPNIRAAAEALLEPPDVKEYYRLGVDMIVGGISTIAGRG
ncbi:TetR/AcrR family transcriptional regulator [Luteipulveratus mongoliensis]|uniref:HTH tetR-type domain-containing protein n=1 Tax=Luteipulveratus mongoliensis TaxID=571913 RepID=A0A0K1JFG4_9MICO|nr:TetR/AcrR family transcriptional regulator [Luteipulveratus mongoliensis]AKU15449.1 hypothetical protein VV02_05500 [Luteipulveratus mongoliensis]